jgi:restriction system protein
VTRYWGVRVGQGGMYAEAARKGGFIAIEWHELGDLTWVANVVDDGEAQQKLLDAYVAAYGQTGMRAAIGAGQVRRFARDIRDGDVVFLPYSARGLVYVGRIKGGFRYLPSPVDGCPYRQRREVEWLLDVPRKSLPEGLRSSLGALTTVFNLDNRAEEARALLSGQTSSTSSTVMIKKPVKDVVQHVLERLHQMRPKAFEDFVAAYFAAIGYDSEATQYVGDGGIDVVGTLDAEGLAQILLRVQVKRTRQNVGIETVLKTRGALAVDEQGAIVSLGSFTAQAQMEAQAPGKKTIVLVDGDTFAEMLLARWVDLTEDARVLLGVRRKDEIPVRERFVVDEVAEPMGPGVLAAGAGAPSAVSPTPVIVT